MNNLSYIRLSTFIKDIFSFIYNDFFFQGMFFKDSNTLAYYNLTSGNVINLLPKERGGRKK